MALLNACPMGFYAPSTLVHQALRVGVEVLPPCLKNGGWECTLEPALPAGVRPAGRGRAAQQAARLRIGWKHIRGLGERAREALQAARAEGPFTSIEDVVRRARLTRAEVLHLARAGAFEAFEPGRYRAAWEALRVAGDTLPLAPAWRDGQGGDGEVAGAAGQGWPGGQGGRPGKLDGSAGPGGPSGAAGPLPFDPRELEGDELIFLDYLATGISTRGHPMRHLRTRLEAAGVIDSRGLERLEDGARCVVAGLAVARQHPMTAKGTVFVLLEDEHGFINVIVPARLFERNREVVSHSPFLLVEGTFERDGRVRNIVGRRFRRLDARPIVHRSRDFR